VVGGSARIADNLIRDFQTNGIHLGGDKFVAPTEATVVRNRLRFFHRREPPESGVQVGIAIGNAEGIVGDNVIQGLATPGDRGRRATPLLDTGIGVGQGCAEIRRNTIAMLETALSWSRLGAR
jgi:hypothetical protein